MKPKQKDKGHAKYKIIVRPFVLHFLARQMDKNILNVFGSKQTSPGS
jgi:hypothetical protein